MTEAQRRAVELAQFYFRRIAEAAGANWDGDNDVEIELMVCHIIDAAATGLRDQLAEALDRTDVLDRLRPTCVICLDAAADRQTTSGPACSDCVGEPEDQADESEPYCVTCGSLVGIFQGHGSSWHHWRGEGTTASPVELYDAGHAPEVAWRPAGAR